MCSYGENPQSLKHLHLTTTTDSVLLVFADDVIITVLFGAVVIFLIGITITALCCCLRKKKNPKKELQATPHTELACTDSNASTHHYQNVPDPKLGPNTG